MRNGGSSWGWWAEDSARRFLNGDLDVGLKEKTQARLQGFWPDHGRIEFPLAEVRRPKEGRD